MTTLVKANCHCARNVFQIPFRTSSLPKTVQMCHCNICRHSTGNLGVIDPRIDGVPCTVDSTEETLIPADLSSLVTYDSSKNVTRYFCNTCNAHMFLNIHVEGKEPVWVVLAGNLEKVDGIIKLASHWFVEDTLDGGLSSHLVGPASSPFPRYKGWMQTAEQALPKDWKAHDGGYKNPDTLAVHCHCKKSSFFLTRALKPSDNPAEYWVVPGKEPTDPCRFITAHCLCNSCRQTSGGLIQTWTIVPQENIFDAATNAPVELKDPERRPKGLKQYISSEGKHRESCGTCGATVFWWREMKEGESPHLDVATALVDQDAAGGVRAESWLSWYPQVMATEFAISKEIADLLVEGVAAASGGL